MPYLPPPLPPGTWLDGRFLLGEVLGQGGFGITYAAEERSSGHQVVIKELAPEGAEREVDGRLKLTGLGPAAAQRMRAQFDQEGLLLQKLRLPGLVRGRETLHANGTAYLVMDRIQGAVSLERVAQSEGRMAAPAVMDLLEQILKTLAELHSRGILHRDLKPSNILLDPSGRAWLIDLGSAREWAADLTVRHTVLYTPGFAPLEQLSENARRGPGTDLYGLAATAVYLLTGQAPSPPGEDTTPIRALRPDVPPHVADALESCLRLRLEERPLSCQALHDLLFGVQNISAPLSWQTLDHKLFSVQTLRHGRFECPSCGDVLSEPKPLKSGTCFVCREAKIVQRALEEDRCAVCRNGILRRVDNSGPLAFSPSAPHARLQKPGLAMPWQKRVYTCSETGDTYREEGEMVVRDRDGASKSWAEWRQLTGREAVVWECEACHAQFDERPDGIWTQTQPVPEPGAWERLYPEEWARVARGMDPGAGNAECERCAAEYFYEGHHLTLLAASRDPFGMLPDFQGRLLSLEQARWIGGGKPSGAPGLSCVNCGTEFDRCEGDAWQLVATRHDALEPLTGQIESLPDWHRLARGLPRHGDEPLLEHDLDEALREAYAQGDLLESPFWKGKAELDGKSQTLTATDTALEWGGWMKKMKWTIGPGLRVEATDASTLSLELDDARAVFHLEPMTAQLRLESGKRALRLTAFDLCERLRRQLEAE